MKTIGVLTSGGDAPGMNPAIRSVVRTALANGVRVVGIKRGYNGLINGDIEEMNLRSVSDIIQRGGTILYTARSPEFKTEEGMQKAINVCKEHKIEGMVVIGGDGSYRGARDLSLRGINCIGVPGTIDNDIACTEYTIGFDTAMNTAVEMIDRLRDTCQSHERCSVVEIMGRHAGYLPLNVGIAVGATAVLVQEIAYNLQEDIIAKIKRVQMTGKKHFIICVGEGIGHVDEIAREIEASTGIESRGTVLGHVQRGGSPSVRDRVMASTMGHAAVNLLINGVGNRVIALKDNHIVDYDIYEALAMEKPFETELYNMCNEISI